MSAPVNVGDVLAGKYQVERVLGAGGMGVVVAARHLTLGDRVAIKFLLPEALSRPDVVGRFLREGQAAARLRSEHVARVHDVGKLETGAPFLVMEFLDGRDLGVILRADGKMSVDTAVDYILQTCEALAEAHAAGIIHRDLKPSNLFVVARNDGTPQIKLIDFGISKIVLPGGGEGKDGELTATAVMMGSPLYMAPEQMANARDVDVRADLWSLGVILHALVTGTLPFRAPSVMEVFERILQGAPPLRTVRADVPEGLEVAVLRCLRRERAERFADVGELAAAIAPFGKPGAAAAAERVQRILAARPSREVWSAPLSDVVPIASVTPATSPGVVAAITPAGSAAEPASASASGASVSGAPATSASASPSASASASGAPAGAASATGAPMSSSLEHAEPTGSRSGIEPSSPTVGPWDQETSPPVRRGVPRAVLAAIAIAIIGAPVGYLALRGSDAPKASAAPSADPVSTSAATSSSAAIPAVTMGNPVEVPPTPPPASATTEPAAASATPTAKAAASTHRPPVQGPPARAGRKSADDLFGTQR